MWWPNHLFLVYLVLSRAHPIICWCFLSRISVYFERISVIAPISKNIGFGVKTSEIYFHYWEVSTPSFPPIFFFLWNFICLGTTPVFILLLFFFLFEVAIGLYLRLYTNLKCSLACQLSKAWDTWWLQNILHLKKRWCYLDAAMKAKFIVGIFYV